MTQKHELSVMTYSSQQSIEARYELFDRMKSYDASPEEIERSLGLFIRGSLMARFLAIAEIYKRIVHLPGVVLDVGTWRGQTAVLCENFRAIFEPLHLNCRIVCFDTFEGYKGFSDLDKATDLHQDGTYTVGGTAYAAYLDGLLKIHERNNAMGHNFGKHRVIAGDCRKTVPEFFQNNAHEFVALAFFDVNSVEPTREAFEVIFERVVNGGVVAFWQLTRDKIPAEGIVYTQHIMGKYAHKIERSPFYPGLCFITK